MEHDRSGENDGVNVSVACDKVDHTILLNRLKVLAGISGSTLDWLTSYLSHRMFCIKTDRFSSDSSPLNMWSATSHLDDISYHIYADDIQLCFSSRLNQLDRLAIVDQCLFCISDWLSRNFLVLNTSKTEIMMMALIHLFQLLQGNPMAFPDQLRNIVSVSWVFPRASSRWDVLRTPHQGGVQEAS
uniref:Reverse transcriptase domain-containing protein n=1 Tax=Poecilia mexicana TaxID=48701 RepID=A0A3B3WJ74_9TELE